MEELVSVIIPAYNCENYIFDCIDSIRKQTYSHLEILVIDDGSIDHTAQLLTELKGEDPNFRILHQENHGIAYSRNRGIANARGSYLVFVDNDDILEPNYIRILLQEISSKNGDMVVSGYKRVSESGEVLDEMRLTQSTWSKFRNIAPWGRIIRSSFIKEHHILFGDFLFGEDAYFNVTAYNESAAIYTIDYTGYHWVYRTQSVSNTRQKQTMHSPIPMLDALLKRNQVLVNLEWMQFTYFIIKFVCWHLTFIRSTSIWEEWYNIYQEEVKWLKQVIPKYRTNPYVKLYRPKGESLSVRTAVYCFCRLSPSLFWKILGHVK